MKELFKKVGIIITDKQEELFNKYYNLLVETNKVMNLTTITDYNEVVVKHFIDSVVAEKHIDKNSSVVDIGSGAGFPLIPLKIIRDDLKITLLDSLNKRVEFLKKVINELDLKNADAIHSRAEDAKELFDSFDYTVVRAVGSLPTIIEYAIPFNKVGGKLIAYKANAKEEIENSKNALKELKSEIETIEEFKLAGEDINRTLIIIKKKEKTPSKYPRGQNKPKIKPL